MAEFTRRVGLGRPLTYEEADENFEFVEEQAVAAQDAAVAAQNAESGAAQSAIEAADSADSVQIKEQEREQIFEDAQEGRKNRFNDFIASSGYQFLGDYAADIEITEYNQIVRDPDGEFWRLSGQVELPYTTTGGGLPEDDALVPAGDAVLRQEIGSDVGASMVAGGVMMVRGTMQQINMVDTTNVPVGQMADVGGTNLRWNGSEWVPAGKLMANSFGAVPDATSRGSYAGATDSSQAFIDAATYAKDKGLKRIYASPGIYHCPNLVAADMHDVYVVGDDVHFTYPSYVLAVNESANAYNIGIGPLHSRGRGAIGFEFDDATAYQWQHIVPLFKEYGIVGGIAWHTSFDRPWIREIWRHGWDILPHGPNHEDYSLLTRPELHQRAQQMLSAMKEVTGNTDNLHFVYPAHNRSADSDDVLSQYFATGRGQAGSAVQNWRSSGLWLHAATAGDPWIATDTSFTEARKNIIRQLANDDARMLIYFHDANIERLRVIIEYCLKMGIAIIPPSQVKEAPVYFTDRYFNDPDNWHLSSKASFDETVRSPNGTRSIRVTETGSGLSAFNFRYTQGNRLPRSLKDFSVLKVSFLYRSLTPISSSQPEIGRFGLGVNSSATYMAEDGGLIAGEAATYVQSTPTLPAANFDNRITWYVYVPRYVYSLEVGIGGSNMQGPYDIWFDDVTIQKIGEVDAASARFEMDAKPLSGFNVAKGAPRFVLLSGGCEILISSRDSSIEGTLSYTPQNIITSTVPTDKGEVSIAYVLRESRRR